MSIGTASSEATATTTDEIRAAMEAATPDHEVKLALDTYEWKSPLAVADVEEPVEWEVPFADRNWWTRTIYLTSRSAEYAILYDDRGDGDPEVICRRVEDGHPGSKRGEVEHLALIEDEDDGEEYECSDCGETFDSAAELSGHQNTPQTDCSPSTGDATEDEERLDVDPDEVRPDGLTEACVHSVADHYDTIEEVADDFGVDRDEAKTILQAHGCLSEVDR